MKKNSALLAIALILVGLSASATQDPAAKFQKNYRLLRMIGAASPDRDSRCLIIMHQRYSGYCKFFADKTNESSPVILAELYRQDGTLECSFVVDEQGNSLLCDQQAYSKRQRKDARRFYAVLTKAAKKKQ